ncbi:MAG: HD domain-containing protein [Patescibacteria group bacterium]|nr:HD domain-containing protein [Patescibacteria group bacterium]
MDRFPKASLSHDPLHGYIPFTSSEGIPPGEVSERKIIDHPWLQRLRQIHQLQTAWWVFPTAEHTRFQHVLGAMHLASRAVSTLLESLAAVCPDLPSPGYVDSLMRLAALLHDVGHGPFGHFFDSHYLSQFGLTHELLGAEIIRRDLGDLVRGVRRSPNGALADGETMDPEQIAFLITRPRDGAAEAPTWLRMLRSLFSGLYTVDNMDFVLRDAYMSGFSRRAFDLERLLHYTRFTEKGLTVHERGLSALVQFISVRADLFRAIYFHRTVRAIDLELQELFADSRDLIFPGDPREHLEAYRGLTEWSLLAEVGRWWQSEEPSRRALGLRWQRFLRRELRWHMACERTIFFAPGQSEHGSVLSSDTTFEAAVRDLLPTELRDLSLRVDTARHVHRPGAHVPAAGQNYLYEPGTDRILRLDDRELFRRIAISFRICRVYTHDATHVAALNHVMDQLTGAAATDDPTNM